MSNLQSEINPYPKDLTAQKSYAHLKKTCKGFEYKELHGKEYLTALVVDTSKLTGDHIHPIALGGDEWDINNIQTLCEQCNKAKTAQDIKEIAVLRVQEKNAAKGQKQLGQVI